VKKTLVAATLLAVGAFFAAAFQNPPPAPSTLQRGAPPAAATPATPRLIALKAARLFDGRSDRSIANGVVIIEGTKIREVGAVPGMVSVSDACPARIHALPLRLNWTLPSTFRATAFSLLA